MKLLTVCHILICHFHNLFLANTHTCVSGGFLGFQPGPLSSWKDPAQPDTHCSGCTRSSESVNWCFPLLFQKHLWWTDRARAQQEPKGTRAEPSTAARDLWLWELYLLKGEVLLEADCPPVCCLQGSPNGDKHQLGKNKAVRTCDIVMVGWSQRSFPS